MEADAGETPVLTLWQPAGMTVAIGLSQDPERELETGAMQRDQIGLVRRQSGGGAVLLYPGVLCWEAWTNLDAVAKAEGDEYIRSTYRFLCTPVREALSTFGVDAVHAGICDISVAFSHGQPLRKIAGTAQLRRKRKALVHGSLLVCPDLSLLLTYLQFPSDQPDYRANRSHLDFCCSLANLVRVDQEKADSLMAEAETAIVVAARRNGWRIGELPASPDAETARLEQAKYRSDDWNWRKIRP